MFAFPLGEAEAKGGKGAGLHPRTPNLVYTRFGVYTPTHQQVWGVGVEGL